MSQNLELLLTRYADGRSLCNCRDAYYWEETDRKGRVRRICQYGCDANKYRAIKEICDRVVCEFGLAESNG